MTFNLRTGERFVNGGRQRELHAILPAPSCVIQLVRKCVANFICAWSRECCVPVADLRAFPAHMSLAMAALV